MKPEPASPSATTATPFNPCAVVTLITDFGTRDPYVGVMKGVLLAEAPAVRIVDLTHEVPAHWPAEAGFWLARSFRFFPAGSVHVAVVDPGVGSARDIVAVLLEGHVFLAPDNGLLAPVVESSSLAAQLRHLDLASLGLRPSSSTFHGRDVFAPVAARLATGRLTFEELGPMVAELVPGWMEEPLVTPEQITGAVLTIDHFGNLITNIDARSLQGKRRVRVRVAGHELDLRRTYSEVRPRDYLALFNSFGVLEIARAEGSAAAGLGLERGAPVLVSFGA
jgi:S-adenosylmethionine hydrolase